MPQMAPIWWSTLFLMFIIAYITIMIMMYFFHIYQTKTLESPSKKSMMQLNWKW